jgi:5-methylcytosine-specific restriction endonuclease McrA
MGSRLGTQKVAAKRVGLTLEEYRDRVSAGLTRCWRCKFWKPYAAFCLDQSRSSGRAAWCNDCRRQPAKQARLPLSTPAEIQRLRYASDPDYRYRRRQHVRSRKRGVAPLPLVGKENYLHWTGGLCLYCDSEATTWDHIVPVSNGGRTEPGNMAPACRSCNSKKHSTNVLDFIERYHLPLTTRLEAFLSLALMGGQLE